MSGARSFLYYAVRCMLTSNRHDRIYKDKYMDDSDKRHGGNRPGSGGKDKKGVDTFHHHHEDRDRARGRSQSTVTPEKKKPRDKSRTRTIFGRKKSFAVPTE